MGRKFIRIGHVTINKESIVWYSSFVDEDKQYCVNLCICVGSESDYFTVVCAGEKEQLILIDMLDEELGLACDYPEGYKIF